MIKFVKTSTGPGRQLRAITLTIKENMYYILENVHGSFYTEAMANGEFSSLQAAEKKLQALEELGPNRKFFIVTRVQA